MQIIFWQNIISPHQSAFLRSLSAMEGVKMTLCVEKEFDISRSQMGWTIPKIEGANIIIAPDYTEIQSIIHNSTPDTIHVFSGTRGYPLVWTAFKLAIKNSCNVGIMSESGDWTGLKGKIRLLRSKIDALFINKKINFILAIGNKGVEWYNKSGYSESKIYDWAYFIESNQNQSEITTAPFTDIYQILYVGKLVKTKGIGQLINALKNVSGNYKLTIIGDGPDKTALKDLATEAGVNDKINWIPFIPNTEVIHHMKQADLFILPSTGKDGWGAVINEALSAGTPCLVSDYCGSSILMKNTLLGQSFSPYNIKQFTELIYEKINEGKTSPKQRAEIINWSNNLQADAASGYFLRVIASSSKNDNSKFDKPIAPWL